jgi:phage terminase large subunit GpA-like protein
MTQEQRPTALLDWSLRVDCPACDEGNDLASGEHDSEHDISRHIFTNAWDKLSGWEVICEHCGHEFTIEKVEY